MNTTSGNKKHVYISDLHFEHKLWLNELTFYNNEVDGFENRLAEVSSRNTIMEAKAGIEQYQNQFIRQKEVIDELKHEINEHEHKLSQHAQEHPVAIDHQYFGDHTDLRSRMQTFRELFNELKDNYFRYLVKWM